jgi:hypothetical protein
MGVGWGDIANFYITICTQYLNAFMDFISNLTFISEYVMRTITYGTMKASLLYFRLTNN